MKSVNFKIKVNVLVRPRAFGKYLFFLNASEVDSSQYCEVMFKASDWGGHIELNRFNELKRDIRMGDTLVVHVCVEEAGGTKDKVGMLYHAKDAKVEQMRVSDNTGKTKLVELPNSDVAMDTSSRTSVLYQSDGATKLAQIMEKLEEGKQQSLIKQAAIATSDTFTKTIINTSDPIGKKSVAEQLRLSCPSRARVFGDWIMDTFGLDGMVLDVAGGRGELGLVLSLNGAQRCVLVDPRESALKKSQRKRLKRSGHVIESVRAEFGVETAESIEITRYLTSQASLVVGLHPDQAAGAIVETALANRIPFAVVPCCVFARIFPDRNVDSTPVTTHALLCRWILDKHPSIRATRLPFEGQNVVLYATAYDEKETCRDATTQMVLKQLIEDKNIYNAVHDHDHHD